jgi:hypothetical protein
MTLPAKYMKLSLLSHWNYDQPHQNVALDKKYGPHIVPEVKGWPKGSGTHTRGWHRTQGYKTDTDCWVSYINSKFGN